MNSLRIDLDTAGLTGKIRAVQALLTQLPKGIAERVLHELSCSIDGHALQVAVGAGSSAAGAGNNVVRLRIVGMDELFAAAFRAVNLELSFHGTAPVIAEAVGASKASTGAVLDADARL